MSTGGIGAVISSAVQAVSGLKDAFRDWREKLRSDTGEEGCPGSERMQSSFTRVPEIVRKTYETCKNRAGKPFDDGDAISRSDLSKAIEHFTRTARAMFQHTSPGSHIDITGMQSSIDGFCQRMVSSLGELYDRVMQMSSIRSLGEQAGRIFHSITVRDNARVHMGDLFHQNTDDRRIAAADSRRIQGVFGPLSSNLSAESQPDERPIALLAKQPDFNTAEVLKSSLEALRQNCSLDTFTDLLQDDLDALAKSREARAVGAYITSVPACNLESWSLLRAIAEKRLSHAPKAQVIVEVEPRHAEPA